MSGSLILGFFDGVHAAHRAVIESAVNFAKNNNSNTTLITFKDSPCSYFGIEPEYILSREDSLNKIKNIGVDNIVSLDFPKIATLSAEKYLEYLINTYAPDSISTGFNHTFGYNKIGNSEFLYLNENKYNYKYLCIEPQMENGQIISSTLIRDMLKAGNIKNANKLLESNFSLKGIVKHGAEIGRSIGFPTANISYPDNILKIPFGAYCVDCLISKAEKKRGIMNWGIKPTVNNVKEPIAEIHIFNLDEDLYDKNLKVEVLDFIRAEQKFSNLKDLQSQIKKDIEKCLE